MQTDGMIENTSCFITWRVFFNCLLWQSLPSENEEYEHTNEMTETVRDPRSAPACLSSTASSELVQLSFIHEWCIASHSLLGTILKSGVGLLSSHLSEALAQLSQPKASSWEN